MEPSISAIKPETIPGVVAILGLGLMGGSLGLALRARGVHVIGWGRREETRREALLRRAAHECTETASEAVSRADLVVLATPVDTILPLLREIMPALSDGTAVTDVGSVKGRIVSEAEALIGGRFVGGHPMCGNEESGIAAASERLYEGAIWAVTPTSYTDPASLARACAMIECAGAVVRQYNPADHDRYVACVSHLPHVLAYGLNRTAWSLASEGMELAAGSFRDGTRVARSAAELWSGILLNNSDAVCIALDAFSEWMMQVRNTITVQDEEKLSELLRNIPRPPS